MNWTALLRRVTHVRPGTPVDSPDTTAPQADAREAFVARIKATLAA
jgi:hypothetical protein